MGELKVTFLYYVTYTPYPLFLSLIPIPHSCPSFLSLIPTRCSHMGEVRVTVEALRVYKIDIKRGLLFLQGAVPGKVRNLSALCVYAWK